MQYINTKSMTLYLEQTYGCCPFSSKALTLRGLPEDKIYHNAIWCMRPIRFQTALGSGFQIAARAWTDAHL